ncbi:MAG: hypothetical protein R6U38_07085 [Desulfatiglandaceae bacterium]
MNATVKRIYIAMLSMFLFAGCGHFGSEPSPRSVVSEAPVPKLLPMDTQEKIQAVHHWGLIARHIAGLVKRELTAGSPQQFTGIYVSPAGITPFEKVFQTLLITKLFEEGLAVSSRPEGNLILSFDIELVNHPERIIGVDSSVYHSLGPGLVVKPEISDKNSDALSDYQASKRTRSGKKDGDYVFTLPRNEIVITTSLTQEDRYILRNSSIYYIDDPEWWQYAQKAKVAHPSLVNYTITDQ